MPARRKDAPRAPSTSQPFLGSATRIPFESREIDAPKGKGANYYELGSLERREREEIGDQVSHRVTGGHNLYLHQPERTLRYTSQTASYFNNIVLSDTPARRAAVRLRRETRLIFTSDLSSATLIPHGRQGTVD